MGRPPKGLWVKDQFFLDRDEDCYVYKRPTTSVWQYYLRIKGEGEERKSTGVKGDIDDNEIGREQALDIAHKRKLEVLARHQQGLKARRVKKMFDFIDDFLVEEQKRIADHNKPGYITKETFRIKSHHLGLLKKYYQNRNTKLEDLDYSHLYNYPTWRSNTVDKKLDIKPPKTTHTILTELTTIKAYFSYLMLKGYISREPTFVKLKSESIRNNRRDYLSPTQYSQTINTVRAWANSKNTTPTMGYNRQVIYQVLMLMSNSFLRKGEIKGLRWSDIRENKNLVNSDEKKVGHLIDVRAEISKTGTSRTVQSPTKARFNELRKLAGIPSDRKRPWPHIPIDKLDQLVITKYSHPDKPLGVGTWDRSWQEIKELCQKRYWFNKNITYYSLRHTGISFSVQRGVPMLQLSRNAGTGTRYIEDVYYHHESESKKTWDMLNQNRKFYEKVHKNPSTMNLSIDDVLEDIEEETG
tara:strand:+ start:1899 stop:3302 length:1404 start_codon:yes stop_codon:yes gene_type:complete